MNKGQKKVAVIMDWPNVENAEYEIVKRFEILFSQLDVELVLLDSQGYRLHLQGVRYERLCLSRVYDDILFCLNLHFCTPKLIDVYMYAALWNPIQYYVSWGYESSRAHLLSYDNYLSYGSNPLNAHINNLIANKNRSIDPLLKLAPSVPKPYLVPTLNKMSKIFYCGINWERIGNKQGRHHSLFKLLDEHALVNIYGPKKIDGIKPWQGFKNYKGSIPFDGRSIVKVVSQCGISLVLSSDDHRFCQAATNRLYESVAAGAVIICDDNQFVLDNFGDCVYSFKYSEDPKNNFSEINKLYKEIIDNPIKAINKAKKAQCILDERFNLETQIKSLIQNHLKTQVVKQVETIDVVDISVILLVYQYDIAALTKTLLSISKQALMPSQLVIDMPSEWGVGHNQLHTLLEQYISLDVLIITTNSRTDPLGKRIASCLNQVTAAFVCVIESGEQVFKDHLQSMGTKLHHAEVVSTGILHEETNSEAKRSLVKIGQYNEKPCEYYEALVSLLVKTNFLNELIDIVSLFDDFIGLFLVQKAESNGTLLHTYQVTALSNFQQFSRKEKIPRAMQEWLMLDAFPNSKLDHSNVLYRSTEIKQAVRSYLYEWFKPWPKLVKGLRLFRQWSMRRL